MDHLSVAETDEVTPLVKGAGLFIVSRLPRQLGHQMIGNVVAELPQNGHFRGGWNVCFFHGLPCGRSSQTFQPFFSDFYRTPVDYLRLCRESAQPSPSR